MTRHITGAAHRLAWAALGAAVTAAAGVAAAVGWARGCAETERYGTWQQQRTRGDAELDELDRELARRQEVLDASRRQQDCRLLDAARVDWPGPEIVHDEPLRVEPYRPEDEET